MISIREYLNSDLESLIDVYHRARQAESCFAKGELSRRKFASLVKGEMIFVYEQQELISGFISIYPSARFIHHLYILPEYQNRGIGTKLIDHCVNIFGLPLSLKSLAANERACLYYESNNWINEDIGHGVDGIYHHYWLR